jgi:hypothetical protein
VIHAPECIGWRCPCYGNCEGFYEGELECVQSGGDAFTSLIYEKLEDADFVDAGYVWAPYVPIQMLDVPSVETQFLDYRKKAKDAILDAFRLPPYIFGIDTGD